MGGALAVDIGDVDRNIRPGSRVDGDLDAISANAPERQRRSPSLPPDSALALDNRPVSGRRLDHGIQCGLHIFRCVGRSRVEVRRVESRVPPVHDFGNFRLRRFVFCSDDGVGDNGEWTSRAIGGRHRANLQSCACSSRADNPGVFVGTLPPGFPFDLLGVAQVG